jgi:hypothetical protein
VPVGEHSFQQWAAATTARQSAWQSQSTLKVKDVDGYGNRFQKAVKTIFKRGSSNPLLLRANIMKWQTKRRLSQYDSSDNNLGQHSQNLL